MQNTSDVDFYTVTINCGSVREKDEVIAIARHYAKKYNCAVKISAYNSMGVVIKEADCLPNGGIWG